MRLPSSGWLAILVGASTLLPTVAELAVPFSGMDRAHVVYDQTSTRPNTTAIRVLVGSGGELRELASGTTRVQGQARVTGLAPGNWFARIEVTTVDPNVNPPREVTSTLTSTPFQVGTNALLGQLRFDEAFTDLPGPSVSLDLNGHAWTATGGRVQAIALRGPGRAALTSVTVEREVSTGPGALELTDCTLRWTDLALELDGTPGDRGALRLERCEVHGGVRVRAPRGLSLTDNLFMRSVVLDGSGWGVVTIRDNTFYGSEGLVGGLTVGPRDIVPIGANYYSDPTGPNARSFGVRRPASLDATMFKDASVALDRKNAYFKRRTPRDPDLKTVITLGGVRIGQNIATADSAVTIHSGRETLVTVDLIPNRPVVMGAKVYARVGGVDHEPASPPVLYREYSDLPASSGSLVYTAVAGGLTCNILLPPRLPLTTNFFGTRSASVEVYLVTSNIVNHVVSNEPPRQLASFTLYPQAAIQRPLRLLVVPVRFAVTNAAVTTNNYAGITPDVVPTVNALREFGPSWWPLTREELRVDAGSEIVFGPRNMGWFDSSSLTYALLTLADFLQGQFEELNAAQTNAALRYDRLVAVLAEGLLGSGTEGFNANFSAVACVVDEAKPLAAIHELAHSFGINNLLEEYKQVGTVAYDQGYPMEDTAFLPEPDLKPGILPEYDTFPRIQHFGAKGTGSYVNIMGCRPIAWINRRTWSAFQSAFAFLAQPVSPSSAALHGRHAALASRVFDAPLPDGFRRILLTGRYARSGQPWAFNKEILNYTLLPGSLAAENVTGIFPYALRAGNSGKSDTFGVRMFDAAGKVVWDSPVGVLLLEDPTPLAVATGYFVHSIDLPPATARFRIEAADGISPPLLEVDGTQPLQVRIVSPGPGTVFAGTLPVVFESNRTNLTHRLWWRPAGSGDGAWTRLFGMAQGLRIEIGPQFASRSGPVDLRIRSSDGLSLVEQTIHGLIIPDRGPRVSIVSPASGSTVGPNVTLRALASDPEDGLITGASWRSSAQGSLGTGTVLATTLSPGTHRLTCTVTDSAGQPGEAAIDLTVDGGAAAAIADPGRLLVLPAEWPGPAEVLLVGRTNRVFIEPTVGAGASSDVRLEVTDPDGATRELARQTTGVDAENLAATAWLVPAREGPYRFRWTVETPQGPVAREQVVNAVPPGVRIVIEPSEAAAAGAEWRFNGGAWQPSGAVLGPDTLAASERRVTFKAVTGWATAPTFHLPDERTAALTVVGRYRRDTGFAPWFDTQPKAVTVDPGASVSFSASVNGKPTPTYQWFKDGQPIPGATRNAYSLSRVAAADAAAYSLLASNVNGGTFSQPAVLTVNGVAPADPFAAWAAGFPTLGGAVGPAEDPDRDGLPNLVEYALASDPGSPASGPLTRADLVVEAGGQYLGFVYRRTKGAPARLQYHVTASRTLSSWEGLATRVVQVLDRGTFEEVLVRTESAVTEGTAGFIRMSVQYAPP